MADYLDVIDPRVALVGRSSLDSGNGRANIIAGYEPNEPERLNAATRRHGCARAEA
jgi:hypothetical protein